MRHEPLVELTGLKNFFCYWPAFHALEDKAERMVMDEDYDAYQHDKVVLKNRAPGYPRAKSFAKIDLGFMGTFG